KEQVPPLEAPVEVRAPEAPVDAPAAVQAERAKPARMLTAEERAARQRAVEAAHQAEEAAKHLPKIETPLAELDLEEPLAAETEADAPPSVSEPAPAAPVQAQSAQPAPAPAAKAEAPSPAPAAADAARPAVGAKPKPAKGEEAATEE